MIDKYTQLIQAYIEANPFDQEPSRLYEPLDYILSLGGKRIRPTLALLAADLLGTDPAEALPAAFAIELFHNFSLIHDDIMDQAPLRRGQPTVHHRYDTNTAILSGDAMLIYAYRALQGYPTATLATLTKHFTDTSILVCEGQQLDMDFETRDDVSIDAYIDMISKKTAVLIGESLRHGAIVAGADANTQSHLYQFGKNIGIAFQIQDDILDAYGNTFKVGKQKGGDILQGKKTYLYLKARDLSNPAQRQELDSCFFATDIEDSQKIDTVMQHFDTLHVRVYAEEVMNAYRDLAFSHLDALDGVDTTLLRTLGQYLLDRES